MNSGVAVTDVIAAFKQEGFEFVGKSGDGWFRLQGQLRPSQLHQSFSCEVLLDPKLYDLPKIKLLEIPPEFPAAVPHLSASLELCYLAKETVVLDIFDPIGQSLACLKRAAEVFGKIVQGEMVEDLVEEFFAYWKGFYCFSDIQGERLGEVECIIAEADENSLWFITDSQDRTVRKIKAFGYQVVDRSVLTYRVKTKAQPRPLVNDWPPKTVGEILSWQSTLDTRCRRNIHKRIKEGSRKKAGGVLIIIESPLITYGFGVLYNHQHQAHKSKRSCSIDSSYSLEVMPFWVFRIDDHYLAQRNIPNLKTLAGKSIVVVGCGTIGGYLADMLVKAGAGTYGGKLTLVDFDILLPQNLGRHRLGFSDLLSSKATAMARELKCLAPAVDICALPVDIKQARLGSPDLIIDATGEESLGHWLCAHYQLPIPILSVWIEGPGTAVRALLRANTSGACYRCLWHSNRKGELRSTVGSLPHIMAGHGCEGIYVPFPASVSVHAASLGAEMTLDWVNGIYSPALRTRILDRTQQPATADCDPLPDPDCPLCNL